MVTIYRQVTKSPSPIHPSPPTTTSATVADLPLPPILALHHLRIPHSDGPIPSNPRRIGLIVETCNGSTDKARLWRSEQPLLLYQNILLINLTS